MAYATPSSSFDFVTKSQTLFTASWAFAMAIPRPAYCIMEMSLSPSPQAAISANFIYADAPLSVDVPVFSKKGLHTSLHEVL